MFEAHLIVRLLIDTLSRIIENFVETLAVILIEIPTEIFILIVMIVDEKNSVDLTYAFAIVK